MGHNEFWDLSGVYVNQENGEVKVSTYNNIKTKILFISSLPKRKTHWLPFTHGKRYLVETNIKVKIIN